MTISEWLNNWLIAWLIEVVLMEEFYGLAHLTKHWLICEEKKLSASLVFFFALLLRYTRKKL